MPVVVISLVPKQHTIRSVSSHFDTEEPLLLGYMCKAYLLAGQDAKGLNFLSVRSKLILRNDHTTCSSKHTQNETIMWEFLTMLKELNLKQFQIDTTLLAVLWRLYCRRVKRLTMGVGDFQSATDLLSDIRSKHIHVDHSMLLEEIRTHAGMGKPDLMWKAYVMVKSTSNVNERGLGSYGQIDWVAYCGYASLGDAGSVKLLISEANKTTRNFSLRVHAEVVRAYTRLETSTED
ncbi:hypothetical protein BASA82_001047 [Batrachochytrium salamandrivorans]|nr:hypothetical protein BASA82_001047 [Batrachochytrium salamandrivorans]